MLSSSAYLCTFIILLRMILFIIVAKNAYCYSKIKEISCIYHYYNINVIKGVFLVISLL